MLLVLGFVLLNVLQTVFRGVMTCAIIFVVLWPVDYGALGRSLYATNMNCFSAVPTRKQLINTV